MDTRTSSRTTKRPARVAPVSIPIRTGGRFRLAAAGQASLWAFLFLFLSMMGVATALQGDWVVTAMVAPIAGIVAMPLWGRLRRATTRSATLLVGPDSLRIDHPAILTEPFEVPRSAVRLVAIDESRAKDGRFCVRPDFRFSAPDDAREGLGHLYAKRDGAIGMTGMGSIFPLLGHDWQRPNVAIGLTGPVTLTPRPSWQRFRNAKAPFGNLREPTIVLLLEIADVAGARSAFDTWGVARGFVEADFRREDQPADAAPAAVTEMGRPVTPPVTTPKYARSLRARAALALGLAFGFYALALGIGVGLVGIAVAAVRARDTIGTAGLFWGFGAAVVGSGLLWSIIPRRIKIPPFGATVTPGRQPRLWALVRRVADAAGEAPPDEVRIVTEVNAHVHETGGPRNRRVLAIGLPLLAAMTEREIASVVAHELGHFKGGDTRLGALVAGTGRALDNTVRRLDGHGSWLRIGGVVRAIFVAYASFYARMTFGMSRQQEFSADAVAAEVAGIGPAGRALRRVNEAGVGFAAYWQDEFAPALDAGARPPFGDGFRRFLAQPEIAEQLVALVDRQVIEERASTRDSHPPLRDRVAAIGAPSAATPPDASGSALDLVASVDSVELELLAQEFGGEAVSATRATPWSEIVERVHLPRWRQQIEPLADRLRVISIGRLPVVAADPERFAAHLGADPRELTRDHAREGSRITLAIGLSVALAEAGFRLSADPGGPVTATRGTSRVRPFEAVEKMIDGTSHPGRWLARCVAEGIADTPLGTINPRSESTVQAG